MGCGLNSAKTGANISVKNSTFRFSAVVSHPETNESKIFSYPSADDSLPLNELMSMIAFDPIQMEQIDANFISIYDSSQDKFKYYVHRLIGFEIENETNPEEGAIWVPYINNQKIDWTTACEDKKRVNPDDVIEWKFQVN